MAKKPITVVARTSKFRIRRVIAKFSKNNAPLGSVNGYSNSTFKLYWS